MIRVEAPDGTIVEFPEGTDTGTIKGVMQKRFGGPQAPAQSRASGALDAFTQGATFGFGDELTGLESAVLGRTPEGGWFDYSKPFSERYTRAVAAERGQQAAFADENPITATAAEVGGGLATGLGAARSGATLMGRASGLKNTGAAAVEGGAYAGLYGAGNANEGDRLGAAVEAAPYGAMAGAALERVARAFANNRAASQARGKAPTTEVLKQEADALYEIADRSGARVSQGQMADLARRVNAVMDDEMFDPDTHGKVRAALKKINKDVLDKPDGMTFRDFEKVRKFVARNAGASADREERRLAGILLDEMDDFFESAAPATSEAAKAARAAYARKSQAELMDRLTAEAERQAASTGSGGNIENVMRTKVRTLLNNKRMSRGLPKDVKAEMDRFVKGGGTQNLLRLVGKLSPEGNGLRLMLYLFGGQAEPLTAMTGAAVGTAAKRAADAGAKRALDNIDTMIRTGTPVGQALPTRINPALVPFGGLASPAIPED